MKYTEYENPQDFLEVCLPVFEKEEVLYGLMLGISLRLVKNPLFYGHPPLLATIETESGLELIAMMTPPYKLQIAVLNTDADESVKLLVSELRNNNWQVPGVTGEENSVKKFETYWNKSAGTHSLTGMRQRIYKLQNVQPVKYPQGSFRQANIDDLALALKWENGFYDDCFGDSEYPPRNENIAERLIDEGNLFFWINSDPVSMACLTRPTSHGICVSYVYTPPEFRKKGYATAVVAKLSQYALDKGSEFCTLYTDLNNPTSNSIYQKIGYNTIADVIDIHFSKTE